MNKIKSSEEKKINFFPFLGGKNQEGKKIICSRLKNESCVEYTPLSLT